MKITPIRVLLAGDHLVVRRGLATLLLAFADIALVGEAQNGVEVQELCATLNPDVILMDLMIPTLDNIETIRATWQHYPNIQVLVLTNWTEYELVQRALAAGAEGYLLQNISAGELADSIRAAHARNLQDAPQAVESTRSYTDHIQATPLGKCGELTEREMEVLTLMTQGLTNPQIGQELIISRATAKAHVSSILSKLGVTTRTEAVALAVQIRLTKGPADL